MKIVYKISLFLAVLISVSACKLDQYPTDSVTITGPEGAFMSYADAQSMANGLNVYFRNTTYGKFAETADIQGDMFNLTRYSGNRGGAPYTNTFNAGDYDIKEVWDGYYMGIVDYNYFIHNVDYVYKNSKVTDKEKAQIVQWKGRAYFYRAFSYFELAKKFCRAYDASSITDPLGLPILGAFDVNQKPARSTLQATMDSIESDINKAATMLAGVKGVANAITPTIDAVNALKARFYLWTKDYPKAIAAADLVIANTAYSLATTLEEMENEFYYESGTESIMQLYSSITEEPRSIGIYLGRASTASGGVVYYSVPDFLPSQKLVDLYEDADTRSEIFITAFPTFVPPNSGIGAITLVKYRGNPDLTTSPYEDKKCKAKIFRVAEMYLIKAEAEVLGGTGDPQATLNTLQIARKATPTTGTLADVQNEWAKETVGEGMRIECLKRWNIIFTERPPQPDLKSLVFNIEGYTTEVPVKLYKYTWPIPTTDMIFNDNLDQNDGWGL